MSKTVSVVVPVLNEIEVLPVFLDRINKVFASAEEFSSFELIFVDDGSNDGSREFIEEVCSRDSRVRLISLSRNFGHQAAIAAGMDFAVGDAIITIDCDLQDPPEVIPRLINCWMLGADVVLGKRRSRSGETGLKIVSAHFFYRFLSAISDTKLSNDVADFRLLSKEVVEVLRNLDEANPYFRGLVSWVGFPSIEVEYDRDARYAGETKYSMRKMFKLALSGLTSFSEKPLQMISVMGLMMMLSSFLFAITALVSKLIEPSNSVPGYITLLTVTLFLGGIQLLSLGVLGVYVSVINQNSKSRPRYVVAKKQSAHPLIK